MLSETQIRESWNGGMPLLNRLLWSNLESLPQNLFEKIMLRLLSEEYVLQVDYKKLSRLYALNKKLRYPVDFMRKLEELGQKTVHNCFHFEALHFCKLHKHTLSESFFYRRIKNLKEQINMGTAVS